MYVFGILLVCGFLFTSVDDCESRYMVEQDEAAAAPEKSGENTAQTGSTGAGHLSTIMGKEWKLSEIRLPGKTTMVDRNKLSADGMGDIFTFTVDSIRISGKAAPNRYASVYQAGVNNSLTIQAPVSTMMASIYDLKGVREQEYFQYLSRVKSWNVNQDKLELYTTDTNNKEVVLVYVN
jgi:heat shock protein HslJ